MKKLISSLLCFAMLLSLYIPVTAAEITRETAGQTTITYGTSEEFTVIIPANFVIDSSKKATAEVKAMNVMLGANKTLKVSINGHDYVNSWELIDEAEADNTLTYIIGSTDEGNDIVNGSEVLVVDAGDAYNSTITEVLYFTVIDTLTKSGTYTDTLTFTVSIDGGIVTEAATASGKYISVNDVSPITHDLGVTLTSDAIDDFSDVKVKRMGKNILDIENVGAEIRIANLNINPITGTIEFVKNYDGEAESYVKVTKYLPVGTYVLSGNSDCSEVIVIREYGGGGASFVTDYNINDGIVLTIDKFAEYEILFMLPYAAAEGDYFKISNIQLEVGDTYTSFETYKEQVANAEADGTVNGLTSISPNMTIMTDADVDINLEYVKKN